MASPTNSSTSDSTPPRHSAQDLSHWDDVFDNATEEIFQPRIQVPSHESSDVEDETHPLFTTARSLFIPDPLTISSSSSEEDDLQEDSLFHTARSLPIPVTLTISSSSSEEDDPQQDSSQLLFDTASSLPICDPVTISSLSSEEFFGPTQTISFPEFVNTHSQCNGTQVPPKFYTQDTEMTQKKQKITTLSPTTFIVKQ